ncbi:nucleoside deaminase [Vineibacter terrae]|uniref:nucleoside deaminase n=1 Tax=Vineibacter terrae TaxID=2586908 RepID=UPI002E376A05|nr:nucleoside deaminase [Vineibacter terrae]HEX2885047.1 nucleoside deaminase [Vineibacter terrae]
MAAADATAGDDAFLREAIRLSREKMEAGLGGPFGAVVVRDGAIIARGWNQVTTAHDPTAHAEITAIRAACQALGHFELRGCTIYTSCEPCPMCLGAIYWARPDRVVFANTRQDAAAIGFDDDFIYREVPLPPGARSLTFVHLPSDEARAVFSAWETKPDKVRY